MSNKEKGKHSPDKGKLTMLVDQQSAQEILSSGEEAARLLDSPVFNLAHRSVVINLQDEWISTKAHEREKREGLYQMVRALSAVSSELGMMVEQAKRVNEDELAQERKRQNVVDYNENTGFNGHTERSR
jgi:hypothetical protein